jgi:hypothetical protein
MSMNVFEKVLANTPRGVPFIFGGMCEPLVNPNCVEMIKTAKKAGHGVTLYTTLYGASDGDVEELSKIEFDLIRLHLPDAQAMKEPQIPHYREHCFEALAKIPNLEVMNLNSGFKSNNRENVCRGKVRTSKKYGWCERIEALRIPVVVPDGETYICCIDFGLQNRLGNLTQEKFMSIASRIKPAPLCGLCNANRNKFGAFFFNSIDFVRTDLLKRYS